MATKVEIDILDTALDNSGDGEEEILGMVEDSAFGGNEHEKKLMEPEIENNITYPNYYRDPHSSNAVAYRLVMSPNEADGSQSQTYTTSSDSNGQQSQAMSTVLANPVNGQFFVIENGDLFTGTTNKQISSKDSLGKVTTIIKKRDDRRRATHNEVERRRRDKINSWIVKLARLIPRNDPVDKIVMESKGGILAKACEYITELKESQDRLASLEKSNKKMSSDLASLSVQVKTLKKTNLQMKNLLNSQGIIFTPDGGS